MSRFEQKLLFFLYYLCHLAFQEMRENLTPQLIQPTDNHAPMLKKLAQI